MKAHSSASGLAVNIDDSGNNGNTNSINNKKHIEYNAPACNNIFVAARIGQSLVNCLVDTGAAYSLIRKDALSINTIISPTSVQLTGVSGAPLEVLGCTELPLALDSVSKPLRLIVTNGISHKVILGRDFLTSSGCEISFKSLALSIDGHTFPLIKSTQKTSKYALVTGVTTVIKPHSVGLVKCRLTNHKRKTHSKCYISTTGLVHPSIKGGTYSSGFYNAHRGIVNVLVLNDSNEDLAVYRNMKVGTFDTVPEQFVNNVNNCYSLHSQRRHEKASPTNSPESRERLRWQGDSINQLFKILKLDELRHLTAEQIRQVKALVAEFRQIFSENDDDIGCTSLMEQTIVLDTHVPIRAKYRNIPLAHRQAAEREVKRLLDLGVIQLSESPYHSPSFLMKKPDGSFRILTDFRMLNKHVVRSYQTVPSVEMMSACWKNCKYFSKMDFIKGFYQSNLSADSTKYTATCIPGVAFFEYLKSPLGLSSSPGFFQSLVERMMMGLKSKEVVAYLDDLLSGSPTFIGMMHNLKLIFQRVLESRMLLSPKKVELFKTNLKFLGVILSEAGVSVCPDKLEAIKRMLPPKNTKGIKTFLGMTGFFRRFIKNYAKIAAPLTVLLKKDATFSWGSEQKTAWETLRQVLTESPTLIHPDVHKKFTLMTDASSYAIGSILCQEDEKGLLHPVSFASKVLTDAEQKWSIVQKELFSLKYFCEKFKTYLINQEFDVVVDNAALLHLDNFKHSHNKRLWRWFETLQNYKFHVTLKPSKANPSDGPSRLVQRGDPNIRYLPEKAEVSVNEVGTASGVDKIYNESDDLVPYNHQSIRLAQQQDPILNRVFQWIKDGMRPESSKNLSPDEKTYFNSFNRLSLKDGLLYRAWDDLKTNTEVLLLCIPHTLQEQTIKLCHTIPMSGHYGKEKTTSRLTSRFYFPKLQHKVALFIDNCDICLKKAKNHKAPKAPLQPFVASYPNDVLQIDIVEALPSTNGYHAILTMIDRFTMYAEAVPLRNTKVDTIARAVLNQYISRHGIPTAIHSDRGGNVHTADLIQALYKLMGIEKTATTAYRPQSNGGVERFNGTLKGLLWAYCQENPKNWLNCLDQVMFAYRTTVHSATGYSPFFLRYGVHPRLPVDIVAGSRPPQIESKAQNQHARDLYYKLHDVYTFVRKHLNSKQVSMKKQFDRAAHVIKYKPGDWVYVWKPAPIGCDHRKFYDHFRGPFKVVDKVTEYTFRVEIQPGKFDIVHMEKLKLGKAPRVITEELHDSTRDREIIVDENSGTHEYTNRDHLDEEPHVWAPSQEVPEGRPFRNRNPVRRLVYGDHFAQSEQ